MEANNIKLMPGLEVLLDNNDDLEATGIIEFSDAENTWVAKIDWESLRYK